MAYLMGIAKVGVMAELTVECWDNARVDWMVDLTV